MLERTGKVLNAVKYTPKEKPKRTQDKPKKLDLTPIPVQARERRPRPEPAKPMQKAPATAPLNLVSTPTASTKQSWSPLSKRTRELTRGIPDYLDDSQCSAVIVTKLQQEAPPNLDENTEVKVRQRISPEFLTSALKALRASCDEDGILQVQSGIDVIHEALGVHRNHAAYMYNLLGKMGYKLSTPEGRKWRTLVEMEPQDIVFTHEMIREALAAKPDVKPVAIEADCEIMSSTVESASVVQQSVEVTTLSPDDIIQQMVEIIEDLKSTIAHKDEQIADLTSKLATAKTENEALQASNSELQGQLESKTYISSKVADILQSRPIGRNT